MDAAQVLAEAGDAAQAEKLLNALDRDHPTDTLAQSCYLPAIRAQIQLSRGNAKRAIELLEQIRWIELGVGLYPAYLRGKAYLSDHQATAAAGEFDKLLKHPGAVIGSGNNALLGFPKLAPLAFLGLARAEAMQAASLHGADADAARVRPRAAYKRFQDLWKDADADLPVMLLLRAATIVHQDCVRPIPNASVTEKLVWHVVQEFAARIGIDRVAPHDLRRTCARRAAPPAASWSRFNSSWDTSQYKRPPASEG